MALPGPTTALLCLAVTLSLMCYAMAISSEGVNCDLYMNATCARKCSPKCANKTQKLYIQGFVPATNEEFRSETIVPAAFAAIDEINADCSIIPGYELVVEFVNTQCDPSEATWQLINSIVLEDAKKNITKIMFLGGGCSLATEPLAALAGRFYKIPMLSYGASSPALSDKNMFPKFFRTLPSETQANSARIALMRKYDWSRVATLHQTEAIFSTTANDFHTKYDDYFDAVVNGTDTSRDLILRSFTDDPDIPLSQIREEDIRIAMGYYYENKAVVALCEASKKGLTDDKHLWMYIAWYDPDWWTDPNKETNCTYDELKEAVKYSFFLDSYNFGIDPNATTDTGSDNLQDFNDKYECYLDEFLANPQTSHLTNATTAHPYYTYTYDAVWTIAKALHSTEMELREDHNLTLGDYRYLDNNTEIIPQIITDFMNTTDFNGVSGRVIFDPSGSRISLNAIYQLREDSETGNLTLQLLAIHEPYLPFDDSRQLLFNYDFNFTIDPLFKGSNSSKPPSDRSEPVDAYTSSALIYVCDAIIIVAIVIAFALLVFNIVTYTKPLIRDSAPFINIIIICGCIVMLATSFLLGVDSQNPPIGEDMMTSFNDNSTSYRDFRYGLICNLRLWFFTIGFTLSFGALFAKTWQVYRVYTNQSLKNQDFQMWRFFLIVGIFLLVDVVYLSFWTGAYRLRRAEANVTMNDIPHRYEECNCENFPYLIGALYVYKGLLVVFGLFLAYESRNVKYRKINDSRFVSIAMYIVVILIGIGAPLSLVLAVHYFVDATYGLSVFMIVASCLSCLLIIHIPKFVYMAKGLDTMIQDNAKEEITESSGLQLGTANTIIDGAGIKSAENEVSDLRNKNDKRDIELKELQADGVELQIKPRNGSDNDSGVLVTGDETETFSTENDEQQRPSTATPSDGETHPPGTTL